MKAKKIILTVFVILVALLFATALIYYYIKFNNQDEQISCLLACLLVSGMFGPMFFLPSYFKSKENYPLSTAFINYSILIVESTTMLLGLILYGDSLGDYGRIYILLIYGFFIFHTFSYPKKFLNSLIQFIVPMGYIAFNIIKLKFFSDTTALSSLDIIHNSLFKSGYLFAWGLIIGGLLVFSKFWYMSRNQDKYKQELKGVDNIKTLYVPFILYIVFIFLPGVWYMSHGFEDFFESKGSLVFLLISIVYFLYLIYTQGKNFGNQLRNFLTGKTQKDTIKN